jgi:hypothetical protein
MKRCSIAPQPGTGGDHSWPVRPPPVYVAPQRAPGIAALPIALAQLEAGCIEIGRDIRFSHRARCLAATPDPAARAR